MSSIVRNPATMIALAGLVVGCATGKDDGHTFEVRRDDGIPVAITTGGPRYEGVSGDISSRLFHGIFIGIQQCSPFR